MNTLITHESVPALWDVIVIGAGPAGGLAAYQAAQSGLRVLLVDRASFPRAKVCGGCLNQAGIHALEQCGLGPLIESLRAPRLREMRLGAAGRVARIPLPGGVVVCRNSFDLALVQHAERSGVVFLSQTAATVGDTGARWRMVTLRRGGEAQTVIARVVVVADGLSGQSLRERKEFAWSVDRRSRVGAGIVLDAPPRGYTRGVIHMAVTHGGYVGVARDAGDRLIVGAALDPSFVRLRGGVGRAALAALVDAGFEPVPELPDCSWRGTPALSRRRASAAGERLFVIGDAARYVEPFTGEGMAWALQSAVAVTPLVVEAARAWRGSLAQRWNREQEVFLRRGACRLIARGLRQPRLTRWAIRVLAAVPGLAAPVVRGINRPVPLPCG